MSNKLKCACFAALCCVVVCSTGAFAQGTATGSDAFSSGGEDCFSSEAYSGPDSPLRVRKIRTKFTEHLAEAIPPGASSTFVPGDEFSGYTALEELEYYLAHQAGREDPFASSVSWMNDGVLVYRAAPHDGALIVGRSFAIEKRWDAFFAGKGPRPIKEECIRLPAGGVDLYSFRQMKFGFAYRRPARGFRVGSVLPIGKFRAMDDAKSANADVLPEPRWPDSNRPLKVYISGTVAAAREGLVSHEIKSALRQWREASDGKVQYVLTAQYSAADIVFVCENTSDHRWAENITEYHNCMYDHVKICLLEETLLKLDPKRLRAVCLHEVGHAFGIRNHSTDKRDAMSLAATDDFHPIQILSNNDRRLIAKLYP